MLIMKSLNILCFGDSITAGWSHGGRVYHPYADSMLASLETTLPSLNFTADVQGLPGDQVTSPPGGFLPRMDILYEDNEPYNWAVILGGTNDLNNNRKGEDIYEALQKVWAYPLGNGTRVLALTVPECGFCSPDLTSRRHMLNDLILGYEAENLHTLDLESKIPFWKMPEHERRQIWDDDVHFTEKGYDLMGNIIAERLVELIEESDGLLKAQNPLKGDLKKRHPDSHGKVEKRQVVGRKLRSGRLIMNEIKAVG